MRVVDMFNMRKDLCRRRDRAVSSQVARQARVVGMEMLEGRLLCSTTPNDPSFKNEWGLQNTAAAAAWDISTGSPATVVADIDTGVEYTHPDLYENIWINNDEIPSAVKSKLVDADKDGVITFYDLNDPANKGKVSDVNGNGHIDAGDLLAPVAKGGWDDGVDGDKNGYVDDIIGWDFANNDNNPLDHDGHGTHTAGVIGAMGDNGIGVSGVDWKVSIMALKIFDDKGNAASDAVIAKAIRYSANEGARVSNNSWGSSYGRNGDVLYQAIDYARSKGDLFVTAAGNDGVNNDLSRFRSYPASYDLSNIISVAASDTSTNLAYFSNYGKTTVDLAAPGTNILSTYLNGSYRSFSGTSMATPFVTGTIALMLSANPALTADSIKTTLLNATDKNYFLANTSVSGGKLDIANAVTGKAGSGDANTGRPTFQRSGPPRFFYYSVLYNPFAWAREFLPVFA